LNLLVRPEGSVWCIYGEAVDLHALGNPDIQRASSVEPDSEGRWWSKIVNGPTLGPFTKRSDALTAEIDWLQKQMEAQCSLEPAP
jgi:hypothetical protein